MFEVELPVRELLSMAVPCLTVVTFALAAALCAKVLLEWYVWGSTPTSKRCFSAKDGARIAKDVDRELRFQSKLRAKIEKEQRRH